MQCPAHEWNRRKTLLTRWDPGDYCNIDVITNLCAHISIRASIPLVCVFVDEAGAKVGHLCSQNVPLDESTCSLKSKYD